MLAEIYREEWGLDAMLDSQVLRETQAIFGKAIEKGVPRSTPHRTAFKQRLKTSTDVFSVFRVHRQAEDIAAHLTDEHGNRRSFGEWAERVQPYLNHQNRAWLQTEYSTAIRRAHDEADWVRFREDADIYPNLEWVPSTSAQPGADHKVFWGTVLPIGDEFWTEHRPGDRWNCKCSLRQTDKAPTATPRVSGKQHAPQPGLRAKPGSEEVFSEDHAYYPEGCAICPFGGTLKGLFADLVGRKKDCNKCKAVRKAIETLGENAQRARRAVNEKRRKDLERWANEKLPIHKVGKETAKRDKVNGIVINKKTIREVFAKNVRGEFLNEVLEMLRDYREWMGRMRYIRTEQGKHHPNAKFNVYEVEYGGETYEVKTKVEDGEEVLYTIRGGKKKA